MDVRGIEALLGKVAKSRLEMKRIVGCEGFLGGNMARGFQYLDGGRYEVCG
jgi:hypothetical protein